MKRVFLSLGSNVGDRERYLHQAIEHLASRESIKISQVSSIYETRPVGVTDQPEFLNMVIEISTSLTPQILLQTTQRIERNLNRIRDRRWGPRTIDLDILLFNDENIRMTDLSIPHPRMCERAFVMVPLCEIASNVTYPMDNKTIRELAASLPISEKDGVRLWKKYTWPADTEIGRTHRRVQ